MKDKLNELPIALCARDGKFMYNLFGMPLGKSRHRWVDYVKMYVK
jgi:hypothetical protein